MTFLCLRDGRGWAFDGKPSSSIWGWLPFASGSQKMVLCSPVHPPVPPVLGTGAAAAGAFVGRQGTTPSIFASRFPTAQSEPVQPETPEMGVGLLGRTRGGDMGCLIGQKLEQSCVGREVHTIVIYYVT